MTVTMPQHLKALEKANEVRLPRAKTKRELARLTPTKGQERVAQILLYPDEIWSGATVRYVLRMPDRWGPARADGLLDRLRLPAGVKVGELSGRQRLALAALLCPKVVAEVMVGAS